MDDGNISDEPRKKRKVARACDQCNYRKIRCRTDEDGSQNCVSCLKNNLECTFLKEHKPRGPARRRIESLQEAQKEQVASSADTSGSSPTRYGATSTSTSELSPARLPSDHPHLVWPARRSEADSSSALTLNATPASLPAIPQTSSGIDLIFPGAANQSPVARDIAGLPAQDWGVRGLAPDPPENNLFDLLAESWPDSAFAQPAFSAQQPFDYSFLNHAIGGLDAHVGVHMAEPSGYNSLFPSPEGPDAGPITPSLSIASQIEQHTHNIPQTPETGIPLDDHILNQAVNVYFECFHPMCPILRRDRIEDNLRQRLQDTSPSFRVLLLSIVAIVETSERLQRRANGDSTEHKTIAPGNFLKMANEMAHPPKSGKAISTSTVCVSLLLSIAWDMLADRELSWLRLQEAITLVQLLGLDSLSTYRADPARSEEQARVYWMLVIIERATVMMLHYPSQLMRPLRLPDDAWLNTKDIITDMPNDALQDFPIAHVRLFSMATSQLLRCWQGSCTPTGRGCSSLTASEVLRLQGDLEAEAKAAAFAGPNRIAHVNLVITIAWFRDRVWTIALRHGLITEDGHSYLGPGLVHEILEQAVTFCESIPAKDLDLGLDWAEKVYDMAMTALMVIRLGGDDKVFSNAGEKPWKSQMLPLVYRVLALFTKYERAQEQLIPGLIKAIYQVS